MLEILKKIFSLLSKQRQRQLLWLVLGMFIMSFVELGLAGAISLLGVAMAAPESLEKIKPLWTLYQALPNISNKIPSNICMLILVMGMVCVATAIKNIAVAILTYWQNLLAQSVVWDIGFKLFSNYLYAPYVWHMQHNPSDLRTYLGWRNNVGSFFLALLQVTCQSGIFLFLTIGAFFAAPMVSLLLYCVAGLSMFVVYKASRSEALRVGTKIASLDVSISGVIHSGLHGIREVQIYNQQAAFKGQFQKYVDPTVRAMAQQALYPGLPNWVLETVGMLLLFISILLMVSFGHGGTASITGTLALMAAISWRLLPAMNKIVAGILQLKGNVSPVQKMLSHCFSIPQLCKINECLHFEKSLELRNVTFCYPETQVPALRNINLCVSKGTMVGIIGLSGAGKSTLVGVITGLLSPSGGNVIVDGKHVIPRPSFLKIGYVPQNPYIVDATLAENVAFFDWGKPFDEAHVLECCQMAAIDFLDELPYSTKTVLGDRGVRLSGGQVQRVAIARALYMNPDILLFDEATSALDGAAETSIQNTILNLRNDMTVIVIAHRLTTVQSCESLFWLKDGVVWHEGAPESVLPEYEAFLNEQRTRDEK